MSKRFMLICGMFLIISSVFLVNGYLTSDAAPLSDAYTADSNGVPETLGGYKVIAVLTEENFKCLMPGEKRIVLQAQEPTSDEFFKNFAKQSIERDLEERKLTELKKWGYQFVGPGVTRKEYITEVQKNYILLKKSGCIRLQPTDLGVRSQSPEGQSVERNPLC